MKLGSLFALLCVLTLGLACSTADEGGASSAEVASRRFDFQTTVTIPAPTAGTAALDIWLPLPSDDPGVQTIENLEIVEAPSGYQITTEPGYGNRMLYARVSNPDAATTVTWKATVLRYEDVGQGAGAQNARYLMPNRLIPVDGEAAMLASKLRSDDATQDIHRRAKLIYDDVLSGMAYDKTVPGYGYGSFERSVTVCKGNCTDFHSRFIGVGRASAIPVRFTMGIPLKKGGSYNSYHCWAHYSDGSNWHPVDISEADKVVADQPEKAEWFFRNLDADRLSLSFGRDITLSPPQQAGILNYFVFPYAEADGKKVALDKSMWTFTYSE